MYSFFSMFITNFVIHSPPSLTFDFNNKSTANLLLTPPYLVINTTISCYQHHHILLSTPPYLIINTKISYYQHHHILLSHHHIIVSTPPYFKHLKCYDIIEKYENVFSKAVPLQKLFLCKASKNR